MKRSLSVLAPAKGIQVSQEFLLSISKWKSFSLGLKNTAFLSLFLLPWKKKRYHVKQYTVVSTIHTMSVNMLQINVFLFETGLELTMWSVRLFCLSLQSAEFTVVCKHLQPAFENFRILSVQWRIKKRYFNMVTGK